MLAPWEWELSCCSNPRTEAGLGEQVAGCFRVVSVSCVNSCPLEQTVVGLLEAPARQPGLPHALSAVLPASRWCHQLGARRPAGTPAAPFLPGTLPRTPSLASLEHRKHRRLQNVWAPSCWRTGRPGGTAGLAPLSCRAALSLSPTAGNAGQHQWQIRPQEGDGCPPCGAGGRENRVTFVKTENKCGYYLRVIPRLWTPKEE